MLEWGALPARLIRVGLAVTDLFSLCCTVCVAGLHLWGRCPPRAANAVQKSAEKRRLSGLCHGWHPVCFWSRRRHGSDAL